MPTTNSRSNFKSLLKNSAALVITATLLGGCSGGLGDVFGGSSSGLSTTASIPEVAKADPACATLVSQIDGLKKDGVADKVSQAAAKKYKMTAADLGKADQLNKANGDFQAKCSVGPKPSQTASVVVPAVPAALAQATTAQASTAAASVAKGAAKAAVAKAQ
jgi:hypothetical protein